VKSGFVTGSEPEIESGFDTEVALFRPEAKTVSDTPDFETGSDPPPPLPPRFLNWF
jgi:hypothetical protein